MADIEEPIEENRLVDTITDPALSWVAPEPRGIASSLERGDGNIFSIVEERAEGGPVHWEAYLPVEGKRVCSPFSDSGFTMYEFAFKELGFRMPFSDLAIGIFDRLNLAPSQLHPNSLAFIRAFEILCEHLEVEPTVPLFFRIFKIQRQTFRGRQGWVSLKHQQGKIFRMFVDSVRGFKERYYVIKPVSPEARQSLYKVVAVLGEEGEPVPREVPRFPLSWSDKHFALPTDAYIVRDENLSPTERAGFERIRSYVAGFEPVRYMTKAGMPAKDEFGNPRVEPRFVNTKSLLECTSRDARKDLLDKMADFADELVKIAADKKRVAKKKSARAAISQVISSSQTTPASSSSPVGAKGSSSVAKPPPAKRQRDEQVIDLSAVAEEKGFVLPPTYGKRGFMEMNPPLLMQSEKDLILGYTSEERANMLAKDLAGMLRVAETAMALNEGGPMKEVAKLKEKFLKLEVRNRQLENSILDYEGK
ncbi:hypothetical protein TSUD_419410, partial [Trifolium subterraneum]